MEYPKDITGFIFGTLKVIKPVYGNKNENSLWLCECSCSRENCKKTVTMRRGNLTRKTNWTITCGAQGGFAEKSAETKLKTGVIQKNSTTGISGVNRSTDYPGMYRARISYKDKRITKDNLSEHDAMIYRMAFEDAIMKFGF